MHVVTAYLYSSTLSRVSILVPFMFLQVAMGHHLESLSPEMEQLVNINYTPYSV